MLLNIIQVFKQTCTECLIMLDFREKLTKNFVNLFVNEPIGYSLLNYYLKEQSV